MKVKVTKMVPDAEIGKFGQTTYTEEFDFYGTLVGWATGGEIDSVNGGELYAVGIVETGGSFIEVPVNLIERVKDES